MRLRALVAKADGRIDQNGFALEPGSVIPVRLALRCCANASCHRITRRGQYCCRACLRHRYDQGQRGTSITHSEACDAHAAEFTELGMGEAVQAAARFGDEHYCPHCGEFHVLVSRSYPGALPNVQDMMYFACGEHWYYGGSNGAPSANYPVRRPQCRRV